MKKIKGKRQKIKGEMAKLGNCEVAKLRSSEIAKLRKSPSIPSSQCLSASPSLSLSVPHSPHKILSIN